MKNLKFAPNVFVVKDNYDIVIVCKCEGKCYITIDGKQYRENGSGIFKIHTPVHKITVPQSVLDEAGEYTVHFNPCSSKKDYWTKMDEAEKETFKFKALKKEEGINLYYTADIHSCYESAEKCCTYFGDDLDILVVNGDYGESNSREAIEELNNFIAKLTLGSIPVIIGRGNHDARGNMSELITDYISTDDGKTYYTYKIGPIEGIVLDCGEDKLDGCDEYGGVNYFEQYRRDELDFLKETAPFGKNKYRIAFCHIPFSYKFRDDIFNIDTELYHDWSKELDRIGIDCLICGHMHSYSLCPGEHEEKFEHKYPLIVASKKSGSILGGSAITLMKDKIICRFTDEDHNVTREITIDR